MLYSHLLYVHTTYIDTGIRLIVELFWSCWLCSFFKPLSFILSFHGEYVGIGVVAWLSAAMLLYDVIMFDDSRFLVVCLVIR